MNKIWIFFSGSASASQPVVGIDSSQLFGRKKRSESDGKKKIAQKMKNKEFARFSNGKQSSQKISRKQTRIKEAKGSRKLSRQSLRKGQRNAKRKSAKTAERKKKRKRKRKLSGKNARKGKRRKRRKQKRAKLRKIEESRLGKPIPKEKVEIFRENFQRGKEKAGKEKGFLKSVENPFEKLGRLRADFRQLVREKVLIWNPWFWFFIFLRWSRSFLTIASRGGWWKREKSRTAQGERGESVRELRNGRPTQDEVIIWKSCCFAFRK